MDEPVSNDQALLEEFLRFLSVGFDEPGASGQPQGEGSARGI